MLAFPAMMFAAHTPSGFGLGASRGVRPIYTLDGADEDVWESIKTPIITIGIAAAALILVLSSDFWKAR